MFKSNVPIAITNIRAGLTERFKLRVYKTAQTPSGEDKNHHKKIVHKFY